MIGLIKVWLRLLAMWKPIVRPRGLCSFVVSVHTYQTDKCTHTYVDYITCKHTVTMLSDMKMCMHNTHAHTHTHFGLT